MLELSGFEETLSRLAGAVAAEVSLALKRLQEQEAEHNFSFRLIALDFFSQSKKWRDEQMEIWFLRAYSTYESLEAGTETRKC
jgi:hypothetical protein